MKRIKNILTKPTRVNDTNFEDLYEEISTDLDFKIQNLIDRRERKIRRDFA